MTTLTLKLSKALDEQLTTAAKRRRSSKPAIARKALEEYLAQQNGGNSKPLTVADVAG
ncbi:MAG: CopG family ribbon-helix-helix protein, partial [Blastocatellia bacterium]